MTMLTAPLPAFRIRPAWRARERISRPDPQASITRLILRREGRTSGAAVDVSLRPALQVRRMREHFDNAWHRRIVDDHHRAPGGPLTWGIVPFIMACDKIERATTTYFGRSSIRSRSSVNGQPPER